MEAKEPTEAQIKELWEWFGFKYEEHNSAYEHWWSWVSSDRLLKGDGNPPVDLNNLFKYAVPKVILKLESRFDTQTNQVRALNLLFRKWLTKIGEGFSFEDALFWAIWEVIHGS